MPWPKGQSGNPKGRPRVNRRADLEAALDKVAKEKNLKPFMESIADDAFSDKQVKLAVLDKLVPSLKAIEADITSFDGNLVVTIKRHEETPQKTIETPKTDTDRTEWKRNEVP